MRDCVGIKLAGQDFQLPVTFAQYEALDALGLCPYRLATTAAQEGRRLGLSLPQACKALAVGIDSPTHTAAAIWQAARARDLGAAEVVDAALDYLLAFLKAMEDPEAKSKPEDVNSPKA